MLPMPLHAVDHRRARLLIGLIAFATACDEVEPLSALAEIEVTPAQIEFGAVPTGETRAVELRIRNRAPSAALTFTRFELAEGSGAAFSLGPAPATLAAGDEVVVAVRYAADNGEADAGHVVIESNALDAGRVLVPISSAATTAHITVEPRTLDIGHVADGAEATGTLTIGNDGLDTLRIHRISLRTEGFVTEACQRDQDCRASRCTRSRTGPICAATCQGTGPCPTGYLCNEGPDGFRACREGPAASPPTSSRGFVLDTTSLEPIRAGGNQAFIVAYRPGPGDSGVAQLVLESNDPGRGFLAVPLRGRPDNLPPIAIAELSAALPTPVVPGTVVSLSGAGSSDPEGTAITWRWSFVRRPEGSRATFREPLAVSTSFAVDLPGTYVAGLEVRDAVGLASTNDARVTVDATAGSRVDIELVWDRPDTDLDLHLVAPGAPVGSLGDCFFDNPSPDWAPPGPGGDPMLTSTATATEQIGVEAPADGVYTIVVRAPQTSPQGATRAEVTVRFDGVEAFISEAILGPSAEQWDVATLSRPSGRLIPLGTVR